MTNPPAEPSSISNVPLPESSPGPAPMVLIVVLHLDCPTRHGQTEAAVPPKFLYVGLADDGQTICYTCLGCGRLLGLKQVDLPPGAIDLDLPPALHD